MTSPVVRPQEIVLEAVENLSQHPSNPRMGDIGAISESIRVNGYMAPVIAQRSSGHVIDGNHRLLAAKALGMEKVPTIWVDVDDDLALRYLLAANRTNDLAAYDDSVLAGLLAGLMDTPPKLGGTAFDAEDLDALIADLSRDPAEVFTVPAPGEGGGSGAAARCPRCGYPDPPE